MPLQTESYARLAPGPHAVGLEELRWERPVRPGDELSLRVTVLKTKRSNSKPDRGVVHSFIEVINQEGEVVMSMKPVNLLLCRDGA